MNINTRKTLAGRVSNSFDNKGNYRPGSMSRFIKKPPEPPKISKELRKIICNCIDNAVDKGRTIEEAISVIANSERIQVRLADYYFFKQKMGHGIEFNEIIRKIYKDREIENKLLEDAEK